MDNTNFATRIVPGLASALSTAGIIYACVSFNVNTIYQYAIPYLAALLFMLVLLLIYVRGRWQRIDRNLLTLAAVSIVAIVALWFMPERLQLHERANFEITKSFVSAVLILCVSLPALCSFIYHLLDETPYAFDISRYPLLIFPILVALAAYGLIIGTVIIEGVPELSLELIFTPYNAQNEQYGILNDILGTFLLIGMTSMIALPFGIGAGVYMSEHSGPIASLIRFSTNLLRAMSVVIVGIMAFTACYYTYDTVLENIIGFNSLRGKGTFLAASMFLSLLVIPVVARATEEGFRSLPYDLREGSLALGATEGYTLTHVLMPWSLPNILTGLLLGCAEVAGSVAVIMLIASTGQYGVGPLKEATSLAHFIFRTRFERLGWVRVFGEYDYTVALLLLIITLGLTIAYLVLRSKFSERYRGTSS